MIPIPQVEVLVTEKPGAIDITDAGAVKLADVGRWCAELDELPDGVVAWIGASLIDLPGGPASIVFDEMVRRLQRTKR